MSTTVVYNTCTAGSTRRRCSYFACGSSNDREQSNRQNPFHTRTSCSSTCSFRNIRHQRNTRRLLTCSNNCRQTRHRASTNMYSLTFSVRFLLPERHQWKPAFQTAAVMLRTAPVARRSPAGDARRPRPAGRSHYFVISRDGRKLVTRVRVMLP